MKIIGIDLGTTNSVIAEYKGGGTKVLEVEGKKTVPSVVYIKGDKIQVGRAAKSRLLIDPEACLNSTKREIGTNWEKEIEGKTYTPVDAATTILKFLKEQDNEITDVVITIPAYFEEEQRKQTLQAAEQAGLNVLRLIPEPTAAAISYGFDKEKDQTILVVDLGGGTFDVSLLEVKDNEFKVRAVDGNHKLGGDDFDLAIVDHVNQWVVDNLGVDIKENKVAQQKIKEEAERVKIALSTAKKETFSVIEIEPGVSVEIEDFTRKQLKELINPYLDEIVSKTQSVINEASMTLDDISRVVLVGGSCKHPLVQEVISENFKSPYISGDMDTAVAEGAAIVCASIKSLVDVIPQDVIAHSLGIAMIMGEPSSAPTFFPILKKNTPYPGEGAVLGYPVTLMQTAVKLEAFRGEDSDLQKNIALGSVVMPLPKDLVGKVLTPIAVIFEFDANGILILTGVQLRPDAANEAVIKAIAEEGASNNGYISAEKVRQAIKQCGFETKQLTIDTKSIT